MRRVEAWLFVLAMSRARDVDAGRWQERLPYLRPAPPASFALGLRIYVSPVNRESNNDKVLYYTHCLVRIINDSDETRVFSIVDPQLSIQTLVGSSSWGMWVKTLNWGHWRFEQYTWADAQNIEIKPKEIKEYKIRIGRIHDLSLPGSIRVQAALSLPVSLGRFVTIRSEPLIYDPKEQRMKEIEEASKARKAKYFQKEDE